MADLEEQSVWDEGVYQLEDTDAMKGGPPNITTRAGVDNVPHLQLARRTRWLRDAIDTIAVDGTAAVRGLLRLATSTEAREGTNATRALTPATAAAAFLRRDLSDSALGATDNLDTVIKPGVYRWGINAPVNAPAFLTQYAQMLVETDGVRTTQMVWGGTAGRIAVRQRSGAAWGAWNRMWSDGDATFTVSGSSTVRVAPDGWTTQTFLATSGADGGIACVFPRAFDTACMGVWAMHIGTDVMLFNEFDSTRTVGGVSLRSRRLDGSADVLMFQIIAVGY